MKRSILILIACLPLLLVGQITIDDTDMPVLNDTFRISTTNNVGGTNPALTDTNYFWDFSTLSAAAQRIDIYDQVSSTPVAYQFYFNNGILYPNHKASYATPAPDFGLGAASLKNVYNFYKNASAAYEHVGFGAEIQGVPASVRNNPIDKLYSFPLNYNNVDSGSAEFGLSVPTIGYYGQSIIRIDTVDGWGTVKTPFGTFNALRVKSTVYRTDTTYISASGSGFTVPRPAETEYKWLAKGTGIPVLTIVDRGTTLQVEYQDSVRSVPQVGLDEKVDPVASFEVYPNPVKDVFIIDLNLNERAEVSYSVFDLLGNKVYEKSTGEHHRGPVKWVVNTSEMNLASNIYFLKVKVGKQVMTKKMIVTN